MVLFGDLELDPHQLDALDTSQDKSGFLLFMKQGTGKTLTALAMIHRWCELGNIRRVLIVGPLSAIDVWETELKKHYSGYHLTKLEFSKRRRKLQRMPRASRNILHILTINYDGLWRMQGRLCRWKPDIVICDECQAIKSRRTKQSRAAWKIGDVARFRIGCSGTPMDGNPIHLWSQFRFAAPEVFGRAWGDFEMKFTRKRGYGFTKHVMRKRKLDLFRRKIKPYIYECDKSVLKLPPLKFVRCPVTLSTRAQVLYNDLERDAIAQIKEEKNVVTPIVLTKLLRLRQITGGFLPDEDEEVHAVDPAKAMKLAKLINHHNNEKIVIFCAFLAELEMIERLARLLGRRTAVLRGSVKPVDRVKARRRFFRAQDPMVFIGQIRTGGIGINELRVASVCIFYSTTYSWIDFDQALSRVHRRGQEHTVTSYHILARGTIDEDLYETIKMKGSMESLVLRIGSKWQG